RYLRFSPAPLMLSTVSASRAQSAIGALRDTTAATVVPQLPPPSRPILRRICLSPVSGESGARSGHWQAVPRHPGLDPGSRFSAAQSGMPDQVRHDDEGLMLRQKGALDFSGRL